MSVVLSPPGQLGFPRPLTQLVKRHLMIHNPHASPVAFKVKTTAPKQYCVRPNSGRVEPGETVKVEVLLQPLPVDPPPHAKCKDKFLVQSAFIAPDGEMRTLPEMWAEVEKKDKSAIQEQKIRCAFLAPEDGTVPANGIAEEDDAHAGDMSRIDDSAIFSAAEQSPVPAHATSKPITESSAPSAPVGVVTQPPGASAREIPTLSAADVAAVGAPTNVALEQSLAATSTEDGKLALALKEVDRLRAQLADAVGPTVTGLRRRGVAGDSAADKVAEKAGAVAQAVQQHTQGVPLEVVAGLVVAVFVLTYLFF